ncbi:MAG: flagellar basal body rod protein FlgC [Candidatus Latescibacteria bacterium]|nr:flagellar basal body rod protein FlgC [Candidatus Latescibacterota bacterium]OPX21581.1 MAG: flagellar basal body rod protein FlgC [Candidatus Latescibacteria bacterium 4484_107]
MITQGIFGAIDISATGLSAQRRRINAVASNIANVDTTQTEEGGAYKRKRVVMRAKKADRPFRITLDAEANKLARTDRAHFPQMESRVSEMAGAGVETNEFSEEPAAPRLVYDPSHPDADENGYVALPDINIVTEMVDMIAASRAYEANVTVIGAAKDIVMRALDI